MASLFKHKRTTLERAEKFISSKEWADCNLHSQLYPKRCPVAALYHRASQETDGPVHAAFASRPAFDEGTGGKFQATSTGASFGPTWATHWFRVEIELPSEWLGSEVHFRWDSGSEALVWSKQGEPLQGLSNERTDFILSRKVEQHELKWTLFVEMACNSLFGAGAGLISPPDPNKTYNLKTVEAAVFDRQVYNLMQDLYCINAIAKHLSEDNPRSYQALYAANQMVNTVQIGDSSSYAQAAAISKNFFSQINGASQHTVCAIGNCHIDSAWLWTYGETVRKCARSWSSTARLMEHYTKYKFACSQAQQLEWMKEKYPPLWQKLLVFAKKGQFVPVGGTWVEMDGNIPSGESFIRQFLYGQKFFEENFGHRCKEFWLPDTFGYSAQLPQIMLHCGTKWFLTQKMSWSLVNKFPHNNFLWEGIDGSVVLAHFPPGDSYTMRMEVEEILNTVRNLRDKGRVSKSMYLYGHGDGGGGPTEDMIERAMRLADVDGLPKLEFSTSAEFFTSLEKESANLCRWVGELYLELHNGTYTTQADVKRHNRKGEFNLRDAEILHSVLALQTRKHLEYPKVALNKLWKSFLLNQFHDVLPGTSIHAVYDEVLPQYKRLDLKTSKLKDAALKAMFGSSGDTPTKEDKFILVNTLSWDRTEVVVDPRSDSLVVAKAAALGCTVLSEAKFDPVRWSAVEDRFIIRNEHLIAELDAAAHVVSLKLVGSNRELIPSGLRGNQLALFDDIPLFWDAWDVMDYHLETRRQQDKVLTRLHVFVESPVHLVLSAVLQVGVDSEATVSVVLDACKPYLQFNVTVDWKESHKFLKVEFPMDIVTHEATYEIQFGHLKRPTHQNTSWDSARFEVCGHKWADVSEYGVGLAVLNDSKYGYSCRGNVLSLSLLRAPKSPDESADIHNHHVFSYAAMPHRGSFQSARVIQSAYELNCPLLIHRASSAAAAATKSWFTVDVPNVVIEAVKLAEKANVLAVVVRLYEAYGSHVTATLQTTLPVAASQMCNGLEDTTGEKESWTESGLVVNFEPFKVHSVVLYL